MKLHVYIHSHIYVLIETSFSFKWVTVHACVQKQLLLIHDYIGFWRLFKRVLFKKKLDRSLWIQTVSMNRLSIRSLGFASLTLITKRSTPTNCAAAVTTSVCMIARVVVYTISTARKFTTSSKKSRCASYM